MRTDLADFYDLEIGCQDYHSEQLLPIHVMKL